MKQPEEIARSWLIKAENEKDPFDQFVSLWFALNALYNEFFNGFEKDAIKDFIDQKYRQEVDKPNIKQLLSDSNVTFFKDRIIRDMRGKLNNRYKKDTRENAKILDSLYYDDIRRLKELLMIIYQVRCNLFHGDKMYGEEYDEPVISNAAKVLMSFLKIYLS